MSAGDFFDTNVLLCLISADAKKADRAEELLADGGVTSVQALNEFAAVAARKRALSQGEIRSALTAVRSFCRIEPLTVETHDRAMDLVARNKLHIYDALIVSAALIAGCVRVWSEDMQDGQRFAKQLTIRNPFRA